MIKSSKMWIFGLSLLYVHVFLQSVVAGLCPFGCYEKINVDSCECSRDLSAVEADELNSKGIAVERRQYPNGLDKRISDFINEKDVQREYGQAGNIHFLKPDKVPMNVEQRGCSSYCRVTKNGHCNCVSRRMPLQSEFLQNLLSISKNGCALPVPGNRDPYTCSPISKTECICYDTV